MAARNGLLGLITATALAFAVLAAPASATDVCPGDEERPTMETAAQAIGALVCDINVVRANHRLPPLRWDWRLWWVAHKRAEGMAQTQTFSHVRDLAERAARTGYLLSEPDGLLLENLGWARGSDSTPLALTLGWLRSPSHRVNMLDPGVRDIGIGMAEGATSEGGATGIFYVAEFGHTGGGREAQTTERSRPRSRTACRSAARRPRSRSGLRRWRAARARCRMATIALPR